MQATHQIEWILDPEIANHGIQAAVLRLDRIHPIVSGNKYFKLKYYLEEAISKDCEEIITFGGAYSNHLHATAFAANEKGLQSTGFVKGYRPKELNSTLKDCIKYGMKLEFLPKIEFDTLENKLMHSCQKEKLIVPMGGYGPAGYQGAKEILSFKEADAFEYIVAASGTGTMAAGLLSSVHKNQQLVLISAVKNNFSIVQEILKLDESLSTKKDQFKVCFDYHFGGYAKHNKELIQFMNSFYLKHTIPTDFTYTGKMAFAFYDLLSKGFFEKGKRVLLVHSGGLQGNRSLKKGELHFSILE